MTNDKVMIEVERERGGERYRGEIVRVLERGLKTVVGSFVPNDNGGGTIRDEAKGWGHDLIIKKENAMGARKGELVAAEILRYPDQGEFTGKVVQVLGDAMDPMTDIQRVLLTQHIPQKWPEAVLREAETFSEEVSVTDTRGRKDLRDLNLITIDGATAKDFDDAIYVEQTNKGFILYVAIADVSHYVKVGRAIDQEAYQRGTSVYFPNFVVPMLPEVLSNGLCSLNPHVDRLCLVAEMHMDFQAEVKETHFYEAVMKSAARVTYGEAQEIIDGGRIAKFDHVAEDILRASQLAKVLMAKRFREGSLDLEIPEVQLVIDGGGNPVDILRSERLFAHRLIEEMMLAANVAVGRFLSDRKVPALYRIHEPPNPDSIATLEKFMRNFGGKIKLEAGKLQKRLTKALEEFRGRPEAQILNILTLRSMSQAKYSPNNVGHFGLGFEHYTHFTSPIRRYPDLIIHRLIKSQVTKKGEYRAMSEDDLATAGQMLSACEQRSVRAERQVQAIKKARFMQQFIDQEFDGMISSVTRFGVFVLLRQFEVDGLVSLERLGKNAKDTFEFDQEQLRLVAKRSGEAFDIGQMVRVKVANADSDLGQVDFELVRETREVKESRLNEARLTSGDKKAKGRAERFPIVDELDMDVLEVVEHDPRSVRSDDPPRSKSGKSQRGPFKKKHESTGRREHKPRERETDSSAGARPSASQVARPSANPVRPPDRYSTAGKGPPKLMRPESTEPVKASSPRFDPEQKLFEALNKRGLKPTEALRNPESVKRIGQRPSPDDEVDGRSRRGDKPGRRRTDDPETKSAAAGRPTKPGARGGKGRAEDRGDEASRSNSGGRGGRRKSGRRGRR